MKKSSREVSVRASKEVLYSKQVSRLSKNLQSEHPSAKPMSTRKNDKKVSIKSSSPVDNVIVRISPR